MNKRKIMYLIGLLIMVVLFVYADMQLMETIDMVERMQFIPSHLLERGVLALLLMIFSFSSGMLFVYKAVWGK